MSKPGAHMMSDAEVQAHWTDYAAARLLGKQVSAVRYMTDAEAEGMDWYKKPLVIFFSDGSYILASQDGEGNNGGTLFGKSGAEEWSFPSIR